jgi:hypothetical protein
VRDEQNIEMGDAGPLTRAAFANGKVTLGFVFGTKVGQDNIEATAMSVGFNGLKVIFTKDIASAKPNISTGLASFLDNVGYQLLRRIGHPEKDPTVALPAEREAELRANASGYGGHGSVMTTETGAPTHSLTALWCPGVYNGEPWLPIFLRRGYRKHLVLG